MKKRDGVYYKAKREKLRSRAYYKLEELDKTFKLIKQNTTILDIGAAPGAWLQYMDAKLKQGRIIGVDLQRVPYKRDFSDKVELHREDINDFSIEIPLDLVVCDAAPEFTGIKERDKANIYRLNYTVLEFASKHLKKDKHLLLKSFQGDDFDKVLKEAKRKFRFVKPYKTKTSPPGSGEIYLICRRRR